MADYIDELDIPWVTILFTNAAQLRCDDRGMLMSHLIPLSHEVHDLLKKAYESKSASQSIMARDGSLYESAQQMYLRVPDLGDY